MGQVVKQFRPFRNVLEVLRHALEAVGACDGQQSCANMVKQPLFIARWQSMARQIGAIAPKLHLCEASFASSEILGHA